MDIGYVRWICNDFPFFLAKLLPFIYLLNIFHYPDKNRQHR